MGGKLYKDESIRIKTEDVPKVVEYIKSIVPFEYCTLVGGVQADIIKKEDHGDLDFVVLAPEDLDPSNFTDNPNWTKFVANGYVKSYLVDVPEAGKCHIDLLWTTTMQDYVTKVEYHQGGTATARFVGQLARSLGYKWTSNGFFKHIQDARGNFHHFQVTRDLYLGLQILGLDVVLYGSRQIYTSVEAFTDWIASSPRFYSNRWSRAHHHTHRKTLRQKEGWIRQIHETLDDYVSNDPDGKSDDDMYWLLAAGDGILQAGEGILERQAKFLEEVAKIKKPVFSGERVLELGIKPGPLVGKILRSLTEQFPDGTDEETFRTHALAVVEQEEKENGKEA